MNNFFKEYFENYNKYLTNASLFSKLEDFKKYADVVKGKKSKIILAGNGASASIAAHAAVDFSKQAKIKSITFNEPNLITCFANDYGYENWIKQALNTYAEKNDLLILISVSGESKSILNAAEYAIQNEIKTITFTGKKTNNSLKSMGDINFWVDSEAYNIVECIHMIWITSVIDSIIGKSVYSV